MRWSGGVAMANGLDAITILILQCVAAAAVTVGTLSTKIGQRLLSHLFDERLAALKHEHDQQIEELRSSLSHIADRGQRSNEKEYAALSDIWEKFVDAYLAANSALIGLIRIPDLTDMSDDAVKAYLSTTKFSERTVAEILKAQPQDRNDALTRRIEARRIGDAHLAIQQARTIMRTRGIFAPEELIKKIQVCLDLLSRAVLRDVEFHHGTTSLEAKDISDLLQNGEPLFTDLGNAVRDRLSIATEG
jgi:hypothetical protein